MGWRCVCGIHCEGVVVWNSGSDDMGKLRSNDNLSVLE